MGVLLFSPGTQEIEMNEQERIEQMQKALAQEVANRIVQVELKNVYGKGLIYPRNANAFIFAKMLGVKTFNREQVQGMRDLGYVVGHIVQEVVI
jgi:hypothetical protein